MHLGKYELQVKRKRKINLKGLKLEKLELEKHQNH